MSRALWNHGGLRFWGSQDLMLREQAKERFVYAMRDALHGLNSAWNLEQVEGPMLMPRQFISSSYAGDDVWLLQAKLGEDDAVLRPETTPSTYAYSMALIANGVRPPVCYYQIGKSFRRETSDGATAAKLRYYEFTQLEFQCIYAADSKADYRPSVVSRIAREIRLLTGLETRIIPSDRLPSYSTKTEDVEVWWEGQHSGGEAWRWAEMCSISDRTDFPKIGQREMKVLEVAIGIDRIIDVMKK